MKKEILNILEIKNLKVEINNISILKGVNLTVNSGEIHAIMGPNGSGKSTLSKVIAGHPSYTITEGDILWYGKSILELSPEERAQLGIFLAFQYPVEIPGVNNIDFLRLAYNVRRRNRGLSELDPLSFLELVTNKLELIQMDVSFLHRNVNDGFSGGEKKRNEILQMSLLESELAILDEIDSGLDIDALKKVSDGINRIMHSGMCLLIITHYQRLLNYITPQFVHVMGEGKIVKSGDRKLAQTLEEKGYEHIQAT